MFYEYLKCWFKDYRDMGLHEVQAINAYMEHNDTTELTQIILCNDVISPSMRRIIADLITGKLKRNPSKKTSTFYRDCKIYEEIAELVKGGQTLKSCTAIIAARRFLAPDNKAYFLTPDAINKAYYRGKKKCLEVQKHDDDVAAWRESEYARIRERIRKHEE